jgi:hypothetical protein
MKNLDFSNWLENPLQISRSAQAISVTTVAKVIGAMVGSILVLTCLGVGSQHHLSRALFTLIYAVVGWQFIKWLKVGNLKEDSSLKAALHHALWNGLGWTVLCFIITLVAYEEIWWTLTGEVFTYVFVVILFSDSLVWATRRAWHFVESKIGRRAEARSQTK